MGKGADPFRRIDVAPDFYAHIVETLKAHRQIEPKKFYEFRITFRINKDDIQILEKSLMKLAANGKKKEPY